MDTVQDTLSNLMEVFQKRMADFEAELKRSPSTPPSDPGNLASDFAVFKTFIMQALSSLQKQVEVLAQDVDRIEMRTRRKMLLLHGVPEVSGEETPKAVVKVVQTQLKLDFTESDIRRCHRMGRALDSSKSRPIVVKFQSTTVRDKVWFSKSALKGTGVTLSEFLTRPRHQVFMAAREKFGVSKCWTREGIVYVLGASGSRHRVTSVGDFGLIEAEESSANSNADATLQKKTLPTRTRRTAAVKHK